MTMQHRQNNLEGLSFQFENLLYNLEASNSVVLVWDRHMDQWNRIESPLRFSHMLSVDIFQKRGTNAPQWKRQFFKKCTVKTEYLLGKMKLYSCLLPHTKMN